MTVKHRDLYLYLALVCFLGIILIFIFDGYMGVYDNLTVRAGEDEQKIEDQNWERDYWSTAVEWGEKAYFYYEVDNRRFSSYKADVEVSLWHSQEKVSDILVQTVSIDSFDKEQVEWVVDTAELLPDDVSPEQGYEYTMYLKRDGIERKFVVHVRSSKMPVIIEPVPLPR